LENRNARTVVNNLLTMLRPQLLDEKPSLVAPGRRNTGKTGGASAGSRVIALNVLQNFMSDDLRSSEDERAPDRKSDLAALLDELGDDPGQVGERSAGQSGSSLSLSSDEDAADQSVEELAGPDQTLEAASGRGCGSCRRSSRASRSYP
jgi:hypothetical protein